MQILRNRCAAALDLYYPTKMGFCTADKDKKTVRKARRRSGKISSANSGRRPTGMIHDFIGCLAGKTMKVATIEEINEAAAAGWAGLVSMDDELDGKPSRN